MIDALLGAKLSRGSAASLVFGAFKQIELRLPGGFLSQARTIDGGRPLRHLTEATAISDHLSILAVAFRTDHSLLKDIRKAVRA